MWTDYLTTQLHLFVALAILNKHRSVMIENLRQFDEILKVLPFDLLNVFSDKLKNFFYLYTHSSYSNCQYINDLSMTIQVDETLLRAETLFHQFKRMVEAIDRKRGITLQDSNQNHDGLRRRKGKDVVETNGSNDNESSASTPSDRLPVISDLLRELLK